MIDARGRFAEFGLPRVTRRVALLRQPARRVRVCRIEQKPRYRCTGCGMAAG